MTTSLEEKRPAPPSGRTGWRRWCAVPGATTPLLLVLVAFVLLGHAIVDRQIEGLSPLDVASRSRPGPVVVDREGQLLRAYTAPDGRWRLPLAADEADERYLAMLLAYEDVRFHEHHGADVPGIVRAGLLALRHGRFVSGASTLTMQVARLLERRHERTLAGKWRQMLRAFWLERRFTKREILDLYLRLAPFGSNLEGARAGALAYFGKEVRRLSAGEAALLVAIPQSPEARRPDRDPAAARRARDKVLARMVRDGVLDAVEAGRAIAEAAPRRRIPFPFHAPHLADRLVSGNPDRTVIATTISRDLQARLEPLVSAHAHAAGRRASAALIVLDNTTGDVLAQIGSPGIFDAEREGAIDMTSAVRSPGSALKPFIYGLAFEIGMAHPETLIEDRPVRFGTWRPRNFDNTWNGTVSVREALQSSLNIPAVRVLAGIGPARFNARLTAAGVRLARPGNSTPSLALALGGAGLTLEQLAQLYLALANGGLVQPTRHLIAEPPAADAEPAPSHRLLSGEAAWYVADVLRDAPPPRGAIGGEIAFKTGTSYGYRDAWAAGFDGRHTVVTWLGRPDSEPVPGLTGLGSAAPLLFEAFQRASPLRHPFKAPSGTTLVTDSSADLPPPLRRFRSIGVSEVEPEGPEAPLSITFPPNASQIALESSRRLQLIASGGRLPLTWLVDGAPLASPPHRREALWTPATGGFARLTVIDADGRSDSVAVRIID
ncbi:MAG: penicillin-binding protein 1C [Rhizobiales bacterium]|nr:penicillin-binding protein 1C [Hyphomicrobiales bacterium]